MHKLFAGVKLSEKTLNPLYMQIVWMKKIFNDIIKLKRLNKNQKSTDNQDKI